MLAAQTFTLLVKHILDSEAFNFIFIPVDLNGKRDV
jgi:hypothetical protein